MNKNLHTICFEHNNYIHIYLPTHKQITINKIIKTWGNIEHDNISTDNQVMKKHNHEEYISIYTV